jgi:hypothetical protein
MSLSRAASAGHSARRLWLRPQSTVVGPGRAEGPRIAPFAAALALRRPGAPCAESGQPGRECWRARLGRSPSGVRGLQARRRMAEKGEKRQLAHAAACVSAGLWALGGGPGAGTNGRIPQCGAPGAGPPAARSGAPPRAPGRMERSPWSAPPRPLAGEALAAGGPPQAAPCLQPLTMGGRVRFSGVAPRGLECLANLSSG